jgi:hypothetical protein
MKDLTNIPERFHILFESDYNAGIDSKMNSLQRSNLNDLFLEYNKWNIQQAIDKLKPITEEVIKGFIDID